MRNHHLSLILIVLISLLAVGGCSVRHSASTALLNNVVSPDGSLVVDFSVDAAGRPVYTVSLDGYRVLEPSPLGLVRNDAAFAEGLSLIRQSRVKRIEDDYTMLLGKRTDCSYRANRRTFTLGNANGQRMDIIFQVSNDGVAFRYAFDGDASRALSVTEERTGFAFAAATTAWLHPMPPAKTGWSRTQPSYEEHYVVGPVGEPSPMDEGWAFPSLFKTANDHWVLICDSDVGRSYAAVRLAKDSAGGVYHVDFPHPEEHRGPEDAVAPQITLPFESPWRVLIVGRDLNTLVSSTLMTDVASERAIDADFVKPGKAAWHWLRYSDESATLEYANAFLDFAAKMKWQYMLIDANWNRLIGYDKMPAFVQKARDKGVDVILWYNSNGPWNDAPMGPKNKMHEREVRRNEFAMLQDWGVKGVKVDFFGGDKQATMDLYLSIFEDAADFEIMVNCHGTTIPRGWQRTYPNLVTMESVKGMEYCTFDQRNADRQPEHACILPFARNVIGSMDFTPIVLNPQIRGVRLVTTPGFEIALAVVFESGVQHFGLVPDELEMMPEYVVAFLQDVPTVWDETRLVAGYPGEYVVMARRRGDTWYIGGINGTGQAKEVTLDLSFLPADADVSMIVDGPERSFEQKTLDANALKNLAVQMETNGGFVIVAE